MTGHYFIEDVEQVTDVRLQELKKIVANIARLQPDLRDSQLLKHAPSVRGTQPSLQEDETMIATFLSLAFSLAVNASGHGKSTPVFKQSGGFRKYSGRKCECIVSFVNRTCFNKWVSKCSRTAD